MPSGNVIRPSFFSANTRETFVTKYFQINEVIHIISYFTVVCDFDASVNVSIIKGFNALTFNTESFKTPDS